MSRHAYECFTHTPAMSLCFPKEYKVKAGRQMQGGIYHDCALDIVASQAEIKKGSLSLFI